jgi:hypothetical protein
MVVQMSVRAGWMLYYYAQKSEFVQYCINLDKPQMHCEGKCILMQRLKAQEESKTPLMPDAFRHIGEEVYFFQSLNPVFELFEVGFSDVRKSFFYSTGFPEAPVSDVFKPPPAQFLQ